MMILGRFKKQKRKSKWFYMHKSSDIFLIKYLEQIRYVQY